MNRQSSIIDQIKDNLSVNFNPKDARPFARVNPRNFTNFGTGQTALSSTPTQVVGPRPGRICIKITNTSDTVDVYIGNSAALTTSNGDLLPAGKGQWVAYDTASVIFAVVSSGTPTITWSEVYNDKNLS